MWRWVSLACVGVGCIEQVGPGPDLGDCADVPEGTYRFGEAGIGSCLSGPVDLTFFTQEGRDWLAVSNTDPQRNFVSGSVVVIDWDGVSQSIEEEWATGRLSPPRMLMSEVPATALPLADDDDGDGVGENAWLGGLGYLPGFERLVVASRLTENANIPTGRDELFVLDTSGLAAGELSLASDSIRVQDDPFFVTVDANQDRLFVGNLTDESISVLRSGQPPRVVDVAGEAFAGGLEFDDADGSGSIASIVDLQIVEDPDEDGNDIDETPLRQEAWTLTYSDASVRFLRPTQGVVDFEGTSLGGDVSYEAWRTTGGPYLADGFGVESGLTGVADPVVTADSIYGATLVGIRQSDNAIVLGASDVAGNWGIGSTALVASPDTLLQSSPSVSVISNGFTAIYRDLRDDLGDPAAISVAISADDTNYTDGGVVLAPTVAGESFEDPFVFFDGFREGWRMFLSIRDEGADPDTALDDTWRIGLSHSDDGLTWSDPETVLRSATPIAAPVVVRLEGRYVMWASMWSGTTWDHVSSWSWDGWRWTDPEFILPGDVTPTEAGAPTAPPRPGVLVQTDGSWRVSGRDAGMIDDRVTAGGGLPTDFGGSFTVSVTQGHLIQNEIVPDLHASRGMVPSSVLRTKGATYLYVTAHGADGTRRIGVLEQSGENWILAVAPGDLDVLNGDDAVDVFDPVVVEDAEQTVMIYTRRSADGALIVSRATSPDGLTWTVDTTSPVMSDPVKGFDDAGRQPHSVQVTDGGYRLWFTADDGVTQRIGYADAASLAETFVVASDGNPIQLDVGPVTSFDALSVKAPLAIDIGTTTHLYYAGFDGAIWRIGHASRDNSDPDSVFERRTFVDSDISAPAIPAPARSFAAFGVDNPVLLSQSDGLIELLVSGNELVDLVEDTLDVRDSGMVAHIGRALVDTRFPAEGFIAQQFPTVGDELRFDTAPGGDGAQVIELLTQVGDFSNPGTGMTSLTLDEERGFLYVTFRSADQVMVVDVRDDTGIGFDDANHFDVEGVFDVEARSTFSGFASSLLVPSRDLLAVTMRNPEAVVLLGLDDLVDNDEKEVTRTSARAFLPMLDEGDPLEPDTFSDFGGAGMALADDENLLLATHFSGNSVSVFDLRQDAWGAEIAWIQDVGVAPHVVRRSPDGRYAVVANYIGEVDDDFRSQGTLAVLDVDPTSERYLEVAAWLVNR